LISGNFNKSTFLKLTIQIGKSVNISGSQSPEEKKNLFMMQAVNVNKNVAVIKKNCY